MIVRLTIGISVMLRIGNNNFGLFIGLAIIWLYDVFIDIRFYKENSQNPSECK